MGGAQCRVPGPGRCAGCAESRGRAVCHVAPCFCRWRPGRAKLRDALKAIGRWTVEIVKRSHVAGGFKGLPAVGSSNAPLPGSDEAAVCQKTGKNPSQARRPGSPSHTSDASPDISQGQENPEIVLNQTLRPFQPGCSLDPCRQRRISDVCSCWRS